MRVLSLLMACIACASAPAAKPSAVPAVKKDLAPLLWMLGDWRCEAKSLDSGAVEPARIVFGPELGGAWIRGELVIPGRGKEPLFELVSYLGLMQGEWTRVDVDSGGRVKLLHAETAGDSTLWAPVTDGGRFRERIDRKGDARFEAFIDSLEGGAWTPVMTWVCLR